MKIEYSDLSSVEKLIYIKSNLINYSFALLFIGALLSFVMPIITETIQVSDLDQSIGYNIFTVMMIMVFGSSLFAFLMGYIVGFYISYHLQLWTIIDIEERKIRFDKMMKIYTQQNKDSESKK